MLKKALSLFAIMSALFVVSITPIQKAGAAETNLIKNPSLETAGTNGVPLDWTKVFWGNRTPIFKYPVAGRDNVGKGASITFGANSSGDARFQHEPVLVEAGATYTYSSWYSSNATTEINAVYTKTNGSLSYVYISSLPSSNNTWKEVRAQITIPSGVTKIVVYHLIDRKGTLIVDDFSLVKNGTLPPPPSPAPTLTFGANSTTITKGATSTLSWQSNNATSCIAQNGWGGIKSLSGSEMVSPSATTTYTLTCTGNGTTTKSVTVGVIVPNLPPPPPPPNGQQGMVTFSFDDSWISQYTTALPIMEAAGIKGTFYLTTEPIQNLWDDFLIPSQVQTIASKGHEIAGHTVTHADLSTLSQTAINNEIKNSKSYLENLLGSSGSVVSFAYPYGSLNSTVKTLVKNAGYSSGRGVEEDSLNASTTDRYNLKSSCILKNTPFSEIKAQIDLAKANKKWYVLCIHEIKNNGDEYSITPTQFQQIVDYTKTMGIKTVTVKEGVNLIFGGN